MQNQNVTKNLNTFRNTVENKYHIYNSLFLKLPFDDVQQVGELLPLLGRHCEKGFDKLENPLKIIRDFLSNNNIVAEKDQIPALFKFIQYIERQIVLFDSVEDASFSEIHDLNGAGSLKYLSSESNYIKKREKLKEKLKEFKVRLVLTAHPTQFYPGSVLGIITDLSEAIRKNNLDEIEKLLQQLGKTKFIKKIKPTPYEEAVSLTWYLENIFYHAISKVVSDIDQFIYEGDELPDNSFLELGFWPGGDRDGNPFVDAETTMKVADRLRSTLFRCYYRDIRDLKRRLTFDIVDVEIDQLQQKVFENSYYQPNHPTISQDELLERLYFIKDTLENNHNSLFIDEVTALINKVKIFGYHFATIDIRQDSRIHSKVYEDLSKYFNKISKNILPSNYSELTEDEKIEILSRVQYRVNPLLMTEKISKDTLESFYAIRDIQEKNGEKGVHRYIISNNQSALNVLEVYSLFRLTGWKAENLRVDIVPLFETINDLKNAPEIMEKLFNTDIYKNHLNLRENKQYIMLGFSDGTKDGGYLMANFAIYKAKRELSALAKKYNIKVVFFDGRGGPPARGGGETHKFYSSLGKEIENKEIQITIQGQTISSKFGIVDSAVYNLEQLLTAGLYNDILNENSTKRDDDLSLIEDISRSAFEYYLKLKQHPKFIDYLEKISTLKYYGKTNIGSRPTKRGKSEKLQFEDLRAIPFVGAWSMLKQNVPGYFGVGYSLKKMEESGKLDEAKALYKNSKFFKALIDNSMVSLSKSFFPLTTYLKDDSEFGEFWNIIHDEYERSIEMIKKISQKEELLSDSIHRKESIKIREQIVLPLLTIQQYALLRIEELKNSDIVDSELIKSYEMMVIRSLYGNINASRNSV